MRPNLQFMAVLGAIDFRVANWLTRTVQAAGIERALTAGKFARLIALSAFMR